MIIRNSSHKIISWLEFRKKINQSCNLFILVTYTKETNANKKHKNKKQLKEMNKYLITETVPYEGKNTWTVFAESSGEAFDIVKKYNSYRHLEMLDYTILKYNVKVKDSGITKSSQY